VAVVNLVVLACVLRMMTKKVVNPPGENPGYAYVQTPIIQTFCSSSLP